MDDAAIGEVACGDGVGDEAAAVACAAATATGGVGGGGDEGGGPSARDTTGDAFAPMTSS